MKVQVKDEQGIDEAGNKHPAPGIDNGTHECELKWQYKIRSMGKPDEWVDVTNSMNDADAEIRQIWVLAEQEKEPEVIPDIELGEEIRFSHLEGNVIIYNNGEEIYCMDSTKIKSLINYLNSTQSSTRIAELEARVAELEGVLKGLLSVKSKISYPDGMNTLHPKYWSEYGIVDNAFKLATNALKNQQP